MDIPAAGIDGCPGGWIAVLCAAGRAAACLRVDAAEALFRCEPAPAVLAIDIPIGLPERSGPKGRTPERLVRPRLGERQSSVFSIPSRSAVYAGIDPAIPDSERFRRACETARATSPEGKAVARQSFHLFPKIAEIDRLLRARPEVVPRIHECHPEVSFWVMNGERPLSMPKKKQGRPYPPGLEERRRLLAAHGFNPLLLADTEARRLQVGPDDLIDACAAAWTAGRIARGEALSFPDPPERDEFGLPIAIRA